MKHLILAAAAAFAMAGAVSAQDAAIGTWQTEVDDGAFAHTHNRVLVARLSVASLRARLMPMVNINRKTWVGNW
jgi:hypothetical protein